MQVSGKATRDVQDLGAGALDAGRAQHWLTRLPSLPGKRSAESPDELVEEAVRTPVLADLSCPSPPEPCPRGEGGGFYLGDGASSPRSEH
jgi:hypothetical protein